MSSIYTMLFMLRQPANTSRQRERQHSRIYSDLGSAAVARMVREVKCTSRFIYTLSERLLYPECDGRPTVLCHKLSRGEAVAAMRQFAERRAIATWNPQIVVSFFET